MKILTLAVARGGTGKTTAAINLASRLARTDGRTVALMDLDPQASATLVLGADPTRDPIHAEPVEIEGEAFRLYPGGRDLGLADAAAIRRRILEVASSHDILVADTPPSLTGPSLEALRAARIALVPIEPSQLSLPGLADVAAVLKAWETQDKLRVVLSRVKTIRRLTRDVAEYVAEEYPGALCPTVIPEDVRAAEMLPVHGASNASTAFDELTAYLEEELA